MKAIYAAALLFALIVPGSVARADALLNATVQNVGPAGTCQQTASSNAVNISCGGPFPDGLMQIKGVVGDISGSVFFSGNSDSVGSVMTRGSESFEIKVRGTYTLLNNTGTMNWSVADHFFFDSLSVPSPASCSLTIDGISLQCIDPPVHSAGGSVAVPYGTPFDINLDYSFMSIAGGGSGFDGDVLYQFNNVRSVPPVPEPGTWMLLGNGLVLLPVCRRLLNVQANA